MDGGREELSEIVERGYVFDGDVVDRFGGQVLVREVWWEEGELVGEGRI